jgi:hypothetical protein
MVPNYRDPRLSDALLLMIAGLRVQHRLSQPPPLDWEAVEGLSQLLDYARRLPQRDPWDVDSLEASGPFGPLLREARELTQREGHA